LSHTLYRKNDNVIEWTWLSQSTDGEYINDGTVTFTLYSGYALDPLTGARTASAGAVNLVEYGPTTMTYVPGSNGKYQGKIPASVNLDISLEYTLEINAQA
jgi:hypothetical protein